MLQNCHFCSKAKILSLKIYIFVFLEVTGSLHSFVEQCLPNLHIWRNQKTSQLSFHVKENIHKDVANLDVCTPLSKEALFTAVKTQKQPKWLPTDEQVSKTWFSYTAEYYYPVPPLREARLVQSSLLPLDPDMLFLM